MGNSKALPRVKPLDLGNGAKRRNHAPNADRNSGLAGGLVFFLIRAAEKPHAGPEHEQAEKKVKQKAMA
ncbi:MAG: hypothetical protein ACOY3Z_08265 [Thermodesulfobacteriota bacterium]